MFVFNAYLFKLYLITERLRTVPNIGGINCNAFVYCMSTLWLSVIVLGVEKYRHCFNRKPLPWETAVLKKEEKEVENNFNL